MSSILFKILALSFSIYLIYLCYLDYKFREVKRRIVLLAYPFVLTLNWQVVEYKSIMLMSTLILFLTLYITVLFKFTSFGSIDILAAPLFTVWFNEWSIVYSLVLILIDVLIWRVGIVKLLFERDGEPLSNPFLITMSFTFLIMIITVPNNFIKILLL